MCGSDKCHMYICDVHMSYIYIYQKRHTYISKETYMCGSDISHMYICDVHMSYICQCVSVWRCTYVIHMSVCCSVLIATYICQMS